MRVTVKWRQSISHVPAESCQSMGSPSAMAAALQNTRCQLLVRRPPTKLMVVAALGGRRLPHGQAGPATTCRQRSYLASAAWPASWPKAHRHRGRCAEEVRPRSAINEIERDDLDRRQGLAQRRDPLPAKSSRGLGLDELIMTISTSAAKLAAAIEDRLKIKRQIAKVIDRSWPASRSG